MRWSHHPRFEGSGHLPHGVLPAGSKRKVVSWALRSWIRRSGFNSSDASIAAIGRPSEVVAIATASSNWPRTQNLASSAPRICSGNIRACSAIGRAINATGNGFFSRLSLFACSKQITRI